jgi:ABC-type transport system involved in multi-copper enzyme maturation permease subunit
MIAEFLARMDRLQKSVPFKYTASGLIVLLALAAFIATWVARPDAAGVNPLAIQIPETLQPGGTEGLTAEDIAAMRVDAERFNKSLDFFTAAQHDLTSVAVALAAAAAVLLAAVWIGIGLSILALALLGAAVVYPLSLAPGMQAWARLLGGILALSVAFTVIMRSLNILLALPGAMFAVARNVIAEATRLRLSILFIATLIFALAALPGLLDPETPLRYRVQSFLQYSTGGTFWIVAVLIVLFSVSTVATEQRDKIIWQTMTKPVAAWQYILGKWIGVVTLAAALLSVSGVGIFLFVEFLRNQPAEGEVGPFKAADGGLSADRQWLESQILTARVVVFNDDLNPAQNEPDVFAAELERYIEEIKQANSAWDASDPKNRADVAVSLIKALETNYRQVDVGPVWREYTFQGLETPRDNNLPIILRFRVDSGSNSPDKVFKITFGIDNYGLLVKDTPLGQYQTHILPPTVVRDDGSLVLRVFNGAMSRDGGVANPDPITFPKDGLAVSYSVGSYRINFLRVLFVLWVKLAFLAMAGIFAGTFLSFSVASLVSFGIFGMAESATAITKALEVFDERDNQNQIVIWKWIVVQIAKTTSSLFRPYGELEPTQRLVDGLLMTWPEVASGVSVLAVLTIILFAAAVAIFRSRELAIYSGQ